MLAIWFITRAAQTVTILDAIKLQACMVATKRSLGTSAYKHK
jgi:hypothetical protein